MQPADAVPPQRALHVIANSAYSVMAIGVQLVKYGLDLLA
jgi:hypothetical protein